MEIGCDRSGRSVAECASLPPTGHNRTSPPGDLGGLPIDNKGYGAEADSRQRKHSNRRVPNEERSGARKSKTTAVINSAQAVTESDLPHTIVEC